MNGIIWAYEIESGNEKLSEIIRDYGRIKVFPVRQRISKYGSWVIFDNGDYWKVRGAADSSRGHRANVSYIDRRISQEIVNDIIRAQTILPPYQAFKYYGYPLENG